MADTTLANDLDEKKRLYAAMGIPEYWVIDVQARRIFMFLLQEQGVYQEIEQSQALKQTLARTRTESNGSVALWVAQQIRSE